LTSSSGRLLSITGRSRSHSTRKTGRRGPRRG
jgi:hypothetical protein